MYTPMYFLGYLAGLFVKAFRQAKEDYLCGYAKANYESQLEDEDLRSLAFSELRRLKAEMEELATRGRLGG